MSIRFRIFVLIVIGAFVAFASACGGDNTDPLDNQLIDIPDVDIPDVGDGDGDTGDGDTGDGDTGDGDDDGDNDGEDPYEDAVSCNDPIPEPATGERCVVFPGNSDHILLRGTILVGDEVYLEGGLLLDDESPNRRILCAGCDCAEEAALLEATVVACPDGVVSPGLINPHDHLTYAEGWPQLHGEERYNHRHDWRQGLRGHTRLRTTPRSPTNAGNLREIVLYGELRMLFGGATSIAGSISATNPSGLLRNLDNVNFTEGLGGIDVNYSTFPLGDVSNIRFIQEGCDYPSIQSENAVLNNGIYLPHIAEGIDQEARNELTCLAGASGRNLIRENTSIIHGIAVNARDVAMIADRGANLVWSPRTNIDLYGNTAPVTLYHRFGVPISLGTDWSTSGSMNMLRELQCADYLNRMHYNGTFTDRDLWKMATYNGAISMGAEHKLGLLYPGYVADVTIFDGRDRYPYRAVIDAEIDDIVLVMRGGMPLYGDAQLIEDLTAAADLEGCELVDVCERERRLCVELDAGQTLAQIQAAVHPGSYPLFFCEEPADEPSCVPFRPAEYTGISTPQDRSGDGIPDVMDNCPDYFNPIRPMDNGLQADVNGSGLGDVCDPCPLSEAVDCTGIDPLDWSGDGVPNAQDNCPFHYNPDQTDTSGDGIGDACHPCPQHALVDGNPCPRSIYDIKTEVIGPGSLVTIEDALVTASRPGEGLFLQVHPDDDGFQGAANSGLYVFLRNNSLVSQNFPAVGDRLRIVGSTANFFGQIQLTSVNSLTVLSSGNELPTPLLVDPADVATGGPLQSDLEGVLVEVRDLVVTEIDVPPGPGDSAPTNEFIVNGSLHINNFFHLHSPFPTIGETFTSITGVLRWANDNNKLEPRNENDIITGPPELSSLAPDFAYLAVTAEAQPTLELALSRPAEASTTVTLSYSDDTLIEGPASVTFEPGEQTVMIDLRALVADENPVVVEATLDDVTLTATIRTYDDASPRYLEAFFAPSQAFFAEDTVTFVAVMNLPAAAGGETLDFAISPALDALYPNQVSLAEGERISEIEVVLGSDQGRYLAMATVDGETAGFPFEIFGPAVQSIETFDNLNAPGGSYGAGSYIGDQGFLWQYASARRGPANDAPSIDGTSLIFGSTGERYLRAEDIEGGISSFSVDMKQAFTGSGARQLELFINGESRGTSQIFGTSSGDFGQVFEFVVEDINVAGPFDLEIRSIGSRQITIDNLTWTSGFPVNPDDLEFPDAELQGFDDDAILLEVSDDAAPALTLSLSGPALQPTTVALSYGDADALAGPAEVTFGVGEVSAEISLQALQARTTPVLVEATLDGDTVAATVRTFDDASPRQILSFTSCQSALVGQAQTFFVELDLPAPSTGLPLGVSLDPTAAASSIDAVLLASGEMTSAFSIVFDGAGGPVAVTVDSGADTSTLTLDVYDATPPLIEDFSLLPSTGAGYTSGEYVGNYGLTWNYLRGSRTGSLAIDGTSLVLGGDVPSSVSVENLPGGLSSFTVEMKKAHTSSDPRQLELFVNGESVGVSQVFGDSAGEDTTVHIFEIDDLNISCVDSLELRRIAAGQVVIDNLTFTPAVSGP